MTHAADVAAMGGRTAIVHLLLQRGANPALADAEHKTAAAYAREEGHEEITRMLR